MAGIRSELAKVSGALYRARFAIITIAITHAIAVMVGIIMVHSGNPFALSYRDKLVDRARASDPVSLASQQGDDFRAAAIESVRTEWACVATGITGLTVISPYVISIYRGWVGGIVSVDNSHMSRLIEGGEGIYYVVVLILQLIPFTLGSGAGVNLGLTYFRLRKEYPGEKWMGYPKEAIWDFVRILVLIIPFVIAANLWEFLSPLNR